MTKAQDAVRWPAQAGYNVIELMFVVGIMGVLTGMALLQMGASRPGLKGDGAMRVVLSQMNAARELAITQRRNMRIEFTAGNKVEIRREEVTVPATDPPTMTTISSVLMEGGLQFATVTNVPITSTVPDVVCNGSITAVSFPTATGTPLEVKFKPDGSLVNQEGAILNGTVCLSLPNQVYGTTSSTNGVLSARAVTVLGSTGRVRGYRFDGHVWKMV